MPTGGLTLPNDASHRGEFCMPRLRRMSLFRRPPLILPVVGDSKCTTSPPVFRDPDSPLQREVSCSTIRLIFPSSIDGSVRKTRTSSSPQRPENKCGNGEVAHVHDSTGTPTFMDREGLTQYRGARSPLNLSTEYWGSPPQFCFDLLTDFSPRKGSVGDPRSVDASRMFFLAPCCTR